jgi:hypothetical protein
MSLSFIPDYRRRCIVSEQAELALGVPGENIADD